MSEATPLCASHNPDPSGYESDASTSPSTPINSPWRNSETTTEVDEELSKESVYGIIQIGCILSQLEAHLNFSDFDSYPVVDHIEDITCALDTFDRAMGASHNTPRFPSAAGQRYKTVNMRHDVWNNSSTLSSSKPGPSSTSLPHEAKSGSDDNIDKICFHINDLLDLDYDADESCVEDEYAGDNAIDSGYCAKE